MLLKAVVCVAPIIVNMTDTPIDPKVLRRSKHVCKAQYSGCLDTLIKTKERAYRAICKKPEKKEENILNVRWVKSTQREN